MFHQIDKVMTTKEKLKRIIIKILIWESKLVLKKYNPKIIAVTGSVGKTSTKDAIFTILSRFKKVRKSEKSFNSEIGLPLTILGLSNAWSNPLGWLENIIYGFLLLLWKHEYPEYLILEVGASKPGDIKKNIAPWLHPDILVITRFPDIPPHIEFFNNLESLIEEKSSLIKSLKKDGFLVLNHDDSRIYSLHNKSNSKTVSFGLNENSTYKFSNIIQPDDISNLSKGISFKFFYDGNTFPVMLPNVIGTQYVYTSTAAIACADIIGCDILSSIDYIKEYKNPPSRLSVLEGINNSKIIDDTYNSSPVAVSTALDIFEKIKAKRKIIVLGDMLELGKYTEEEHFKIGERLRGVADILITVGARAHFIVEGAIDNKFNKKNIYSFNSSETVSKFLEGIIEEGDLILLKASQAIRLEKTVLCIMQEKNNSFEIICRQEKEWKDKK